MDRMTKDHKLLHMSKDKINELKFTLNILENDERVDEVVCKLV
jgi:hypothetical protein